MGLFCVSGKVSLMNSGHFEKCPRYHSRTHKKRILKRFGYPPNMEQKAIKLILEQAERAPNGRGYPDG